MAQHHPDRVYELISDQHLILDAHQQFNTESVLNYDSAFRSLMAENPHTRWDQVNTTLWSTKMLQGVRPSCPQCTKTHSRDRCMMHTSSSVPFGQARRPKQGGTKFALTSTEDVRASSNPVDCATPVASAENGVTAHTCAKRRDPTVSHPQPVKPNQGRTQRGFEGGSPNPAGGLGGAVSPPAGSGAEPRKI